MCFYTIDGWFGENIGPGVQKWNYDYSNGTTTKQPAKSNYTLDELKEGIYNDIRAMFFADRASAWGHADSFLDNQYAVNMGATYDKYGVSHFELFKNTDGFK